ncbi:Ribosomal protein S5 domain 2-type fold protein [Ascosphaera apis ARSEF 7405]|uniref:Ribosomal RNA-processing protein 43 n=1 Tax=Ascosphaera apis ARSEF 7405 TaxID=392613 RepID=A0A168CBQ5_9EURO|nr:Ribosomal protein S5 domain 2-type fold protein [Ascosphaera apis ARSEF 7405]
MASETVHLPPPSLQPPPSLSLPPSQFARLQPHAYLLAHLDPASNSRPSLRPDGRSRTQFRPATVNTGSLTHSNGGAVVRIGDATAVCGVRAEILSVDDIAGWKVHAPGSSESKVDGVKRRGSEVDLDDDREIAAFNLLVPNISLNTGCMPSVQPGTAPAPHAQTLTHELLSVLHTSRLVRLEDLRIMHRPPNLTKLGPSNTESPMDEDDEETVPETKAFWTLYIDILMLSVSGNPFDVAWAAMIAALQNTRLPKAWWDMDRETILCSDRMEDARKLALRGCPVASSFAVFESDPAIEWRAVVPEGRDESTKAQTTTRKRWLLADPDAFEDSLCVEKALVVVDSRANDPSKMRVIKMEKNGGLSLGRKEMHEIVELASERWKEMKEVLEASRE